MACFADFAVGDSVFFSRVITRDHFTAFAELSGDLNPLHHDAEYARGSEFGETIVPLHLMAAPLSAVAGMAFPGEPSLYLGHELKALSPAFYGDELGYSARVAAINRSHRVLTLRVLVLRGSTVLVEGTMRVQARQEQWQIPPAWEVVRAGRRRTALVTGAAGGIGSACAAALAAGGWDLVLHYHRDRDGADRLREECQRLGAQVSLVRASLARAEERAGLLEALREHAPTLVVHAASPPVHAPLAELMEVNFTAWKEIAAAVLPAALRRQEGRLVLIGSTAVQYHPEGWEDYVAAKSAAATLTTGLHRQYGRYGITAVTLAPGYVRTPFSDALRPAGAPALLPEEVAEAVVRAAAGEGSASYVVLDPSRGELAGELGFREAGQAQAPAPAGPEARPAAPAAPSGSAGGSPSGGDLRLEELIRRRFRLPGVLDLADAGVDRTPGWDSLGHIGLILAVEEALGVHFTSGEIERTRTLAGLKELCREKQLQEA